MRVEDMRARDKVSDAQRRLDQEALRTEEERQVVAGAMLKRKPTVQPEGELAVLLAEARRRGLLAAVKQPLTAVQEAEWERCKGDPCYFISHYLYTYDPRRIHGDPYFLLKLFPKQEELIRWFDARYLAQEDGLVEKSRDSGVSYCALGYAMWRWLFTAGFAAGFGSYKLEKIDKKDDPSSLFVKLRLMMRRLPEWMMPAGWNEAGCAPECRFINPENGSILTGEGGDEVGRGGRTSIYFVDEAAHLEHQTLVDRSLSNTTNCRIYISTPNGMDEFYMKRDRMPRFTFHWKDDPRKNRWIVGGGKKGGGKYGVDTYAIVKEGAGWDAPEGAVYPWYENEKRRHDADTIAQEVDINYLGSGNPRFDRPFLMEEFDRCTVEFPEVCLSVEKSPWAGEVTTFADKEPGASYVIVADVAEGLSATGEADWSVAHVYETLNWEQVVHYRGQMDTHDYGVDLATLGMQYADRGLPALICVLRKGPGVAVLEYLMNQHDQGAGYPNLYVYAGIIGGMLQTRPGFPENRPSNVAAEEELASILREMKQGQEGFLWHHPHTIEEMIYFVRKPGGRCEAEKGHNDDEVAVCRMAAVLLQEVTPRRRLRPGDPPPPQVHYNPGAGNRRR